VRSELFDRFDLHEKQNTVTASPPRKADIRRSNQEMSFNVSNKKKETTLVTSNQYVAKENKGTRSEVVKKAHKACLEGAPYVEDDLCMFCHKVVDERHETQEQAKATALNYQYKQSASPKRHTSSLINSINEVNRSSQKNTASFQDSKKCVGRTGYPCSDLCMFCHEPVRDSNDKGYYSPKKIVGSRNDSLSKSRDNLRETLINSSINFEKRISNLDGGNINYDRGYQYRNPSGSNANYNKSEIINSSDYKLSNISNMNEENPVTANKNNSSLVNANMSTIRAKQIDSTCKKDMRSTASKDPTLLLTLLVGDW